ADLCRLGGSHLSVVPTQSARPSTHACSPTTAPAKVARMDDATLRDQIESLVGEERRLMGEAAGAGPDDERHERLRQIKVDLDQCWDLLRQRQGPEEFGVDPDTSS